MNSAISAYRFVSESSLEGRQLEAYLLRKAAGRLSALSSKDCCDIVFEEALTYNRRLWTVIVSLLSSASNKMEISLKSNLLSLAAFIFKQTNIALSSRKIEEIEPLIDINLQLSAGLDGRE